MAQGHTASLEGWVKGQGEYQSFWIKWKWKPNIAALCDVGKMIFKGKIYSLNLLKEILGRTNLKEILELNSYIGKKKQKPVI